VTLAAEDFRYISDLVRQHAAIVLEPGKEYLVESRLVPVVRDELEGGSLAELVQRLQSGSQPSLTAKVVEAMTTNETSWFRDNHPFDLFANHILTQLERTRGAQRSVDVWCAAASTGQEPYSLAMLLQDWQLAHPGWTARIVATDINEAVLERARQGRYSQLEVNRGLPVQRLVRHFSRVGTEWELEEGLRRMVDFRQLNLAAPFPMAAGAYDVVFCRNVLIYFDTATKRVILDRIKRVLRPEGFLVLGGAETTLNIDDDFERVQIDRATCYRLRSGKARA
jgi:chemotaxis protein methyltransferase CheR